MTAGAFPFRRRGAGAGGGGGGGGGGGSGSDTFCRLVRRADGALAGSASAIGLESRAGAFRFLVGADGRAGGLVGGKTEGVEADISEDVAACRVEARVLLEDMSIWLCNLHSNSVTSHDYPVVMRSGRLTKCSCEVGVKRSRVVIKE
jgi:hypothetical protein